MAKGEVIIRTASCKGCGLCVSVCPKEVLVLDDKNTNHKGYFPSRAIRPENCIGCVNCAMMCPDMVIVVKR